MATDLQEHVKVGAGWRDDAGLIWLIESCDGLEALLVRWAGDVGGELRREQRRVARVALMERWRPVSPEEVEELQGRLYGTAARDQVEKIRQAAADVRVESDSMQRAREHRERRDDHPTRGAVPVAEKMLWPSAGDRRRVEGTVIEPRAGGCVGVALDKGSEFNGVIVMADVGAHVEAAVGSRVVVDVESELLGNPGTTTMRLHPRSARIVAAAATDVPVGFRKYNDPGFRIGHTVSPFCAGCGASAAREGYVGEPCPEGETTRAMLQQGSLFHVYEARQDAPMPARGGTTLTDLADRLYAAGGELVEASHAIAAFAAAMRDDLDTATDGR